MLVIKTKLKEIPCKEIGLIADQKIKKEQVVWEYNPIIDIKIMKNRIDNNMKPFFEKYACDLGGNFWMFNTDNARFINHSDKPNIKSLGHFKESIALRNIKKGEEITTDYNIIDVNGANFKYNKEL